MANDLKASDYEDEWLKCLLTDNQKADHQKVKYQDLLTLTMDYLRFYISYIDDPNYIVHEGEVKYKGLLIEDYTPIPLDQEINGVSYLDKITAIFNPNL